MTHITPTNFRRLLRCTSLLVAVAVVVAWAAAARADTIRLHRTVSVAGPSVTLGEIAELEGAAAKALAATVVGTFDAKSPAGELTLTLAQMRTALDAAGANWGLLSVRGYQACRVERLVAVTPPRVVTAPAEVAANPRSEVRLDTALTLQAQVLDLLQEMAGVSAEDLRVRFHDRDAEVLARSVLRDRYEFEPRAASAIGRVPITVRRYEGDRVAETFTLTVDVERRTRALVATQTIGRSATFGPGSVQLREVYLSDDHGEPLTDPAQVLGQRAAGVLREGAVIYASHVEPEVLIRRGELVTVRCMVGNLVVRTVARARGEGALGDVIQLRNESSREEYFATVTGRHEATVRTVSPEASDAPATLAAAGEDAS